MTAQGGSPTATPVAPLRGGAEARLWSRRWRWARGRSSGTGGAGGGGGRRAVRPGPGGGGAGRGRSKAMLLGEAGGAGCVLGINAARGGGDGVQGPELSLRAGCSAPNLQIRYLGRSLRDRPSGQGRRLMPLLSYCPALVCPNLLGLYPPCDVVLCPGENWGGPANGRANACRRRLAAVELGQPSPLTFDFCLSTSIPVLTTGTCVVAWPQGDHFWVETCDTRGQGPPAQWLSLPFYTPEGAWRLSCQYPEPKGGSS